MDIIINGREIDVNGIIKVCQAMAENYDFVRCDSIGKSVGGRSIPAVMIGDAEEYVLYAGGFHGSERLTVLLLLKFADELCRCRKEGTAISDVRAEALLWDKGLAVVPVVNPDGYEVSLVGWQKGGAFASKIKRLSGGDTTHWNANLRGVDINHNFNADWGKTAEVTKQSGVWGAGPSKYGGTRPESEPETAALVAFCKNYKFRHAMAFHSQGEVIYAPDAGEDIPRAAKAAQILSFSSGYPISAPTGTAVGAGFKDWFVKEFHRPAFTVEIGRGENPLPPEDLTEIYDRLKEMLVLGVLL